MDQACVFTRTSLLVISLMTLMYRFKGTTVGTHSQAAWLRLLVPRSPRYLGRFPALFTRTIDACSYPKNRPPRASTLYPGQYSRSTRRILETPHSVSLRRDPRGFPSSCFSAVFPQRHRATGVETACIYPETRTEAVRVELVWLESQGRGFAWCNQEVRSPMPQCPAQFRC